MENYPIFISCKTLKKYCFEKKTNPNTEKSQEFNSDCLLTYFQSSQTKPKLLIYAKPWSFVRFTIY